MLRNLKGGETMIEFIIEFFIIFIGLTIATALVIGLNYLSWQAEIKRAIDQDLSKKENQN